MKLLFLIVPAILTALSIVFSPIIEEKKFKTSLIDKTITVSVTIIDESKNEIEIYSTNGVIEKIAGDTLEIKRKMQPKFRVPFRAQNILFNNDTMSYESEYFSTFLNNLREELDPNKGIFLK